MGFPQASPFLRTFESWVTTSRVVSAELWQVKVALTVFSATPKTPAGRDCGFAA